MPTIDTHYAPPAPAPQPTVLPRRFRTLLATAHFGTQVAIGATIEVLLPAQVQGIVVTDDRATSLALVLGVGVLGSLIGVPVIGAASDRAGRRKPFLLAGALATPVALLAVSAAPTIPALVAAWVAAQLCFNLIYAPLLALLPDVVPVAHRARIAGLTITANSAGLVAGIGLGAALGAGGTLAYLVSGLVLAAAAVPLLALWREAPLPVRDTPGLRARWHGVTALLGPRSPHSDYRTVWTSRLFIQLTVALVTLYLLYVLQNRYAVDAAHAAGIQTGLLALYVVGTAVAALTVGVLSDRAGRRVPFAVGAAVVLAAGIVLFTVTTTTGPALVAFALAGIGFGGFLACDQALVSQVLPARTDHARDLGVVNIAIAGPQLIAPAVGAVVLSTLGDPAGYAPLYLLAAACALAAGALLLRVRGVA